MDDLGKVLASLILMAAAMVFAVIYAAIRAVQLAYEFVVDILAKVFLFAREIIPYIGLSALIIFVIVCTLVLLIKLFRNQFVFGDVISICAMGVFF